MFVYVNFYVLLTGTMALKSQTHFWEVPIYKRALTFVFMMRYFLGHESQRQWHRFSVRDLKFNTRCFKRWVDHEFDILKESKELNSLPEDYENPLVKAKSKRSNMSSDHLSSESPVKRRFIVKDDSTDEEE